MLACVVADTDHAGNCRYSAGRDEGCTGGSVCTNIDTVMIDGSNSGVGVLGIAFFTATMFPFLSATLYILYVLV